MVNGNPVSYTPKGLISSSSHQNYTASENRSCGNITRSFQRNHIATGLPLAFSPCQQVTNFHLSIF